MTKVERNSPCPCGSGKKFKLCCLKRDEVSGGRAPSKIDSISDTLQQAIEQHLAGHLPQAESIYRKILQADANHIDALHLMGVLAHQTGRNDIAVALTGKALSLKPDFCEARNNMGLMLKSQGKLDEAAEHYHQALASKPDFAEAHYNLGIVLYEQGNLGRAEEHFRTALVCKPEYTEAHNNLGALLKEQGCYVEAEISLRRALELKPDYVDAYNNLGETLREQGQHVEAEASFRLALEINPDHAEAHRNLGSVFQDVGRIDEAVACYRRALEINPCYAEAHGNLGIAFQSLGRIDDAIGCYRRALEEKPDYAEAQSNMGNALKAIGRLDDASACYRKALLLRPDFPEAFNNLGNALKDQGKLDETQKSYAQALALKPRYAEAHNNLGIVLGAQGMLDAAVESFGTALTINPELAAALNNMGNALKDQGKLDAALESYRKAITLRSDFLEAHSNLLFTMNYHPDLSGAEIFAAYQKYDEQFALPHRAEWRAFANDMHPKRRLRIGYVSPDFRQHPVRHFLEPLLAHHDQAAVEVFAYAELSQEDAVTARYKGYVDYWVPTFCLSDEALSERIRADHIDILVDLAGHTEGNRLQVFARKPAPVSMSWLGYGYTTGLTAIDYFLTDNVGAPEGTEALFAEEPWRLGTPGYVFRPGEGMGAVNALPANRHGYVTFGTLTRAVRINHRTIRVWAEILKRVDGARLVIDSGNYQDATMRDLLAAKFAAHGIERSRLEIGYHSPPWDVLRGIDIGLDCFPHNSGTTLFETLYMGIPFVTLAGRPSVGRLGSSILEGIGHPEWIARTEDEYIEKAVALAADLPKLAALRSSLREEMQASALMDEAGFARKVEAAYRTMWVRWCDRDQARPSTSIDGNLSF
jgi:predicted O-linked N-acetylglucosamine transferase (SPINDLY family)